MEVVLPHSWVVVFQASARRWSLQKPVGRPVASFCIRRVVVLFDRKQKLTNPVRRPPRPRDPLPPEILGLEPEESVRLDEDQFAKNIRSARRGAVPRPSGMTSEHLFPILESDRTLASVCQVAGFLARAEVPLSILSALRLGRMTALRKPCGGVRGIVVSDVFRRLVARTLAQQFAKKAETATASF